MSPTKTQKSDPSQGLKPGPLNLESVAQRRKRCSCAVDFGSSSRLSIYKMADGESKISTPLSWLLATSCSLKVSIKKLGVFGQSPVQVFWLWSKGSKRCFQFYQAIKLFQEESFSFSNLTRGSVFRLFKVVSSSLRFWTANFCRLFNFTKHMKYEFFFSCWWKF